MRKSFLFLLFVAIAFASMPSVLADSEAEKSPEQIVEDANESIDELIADAQVKAEESDNDEQIIGTLQVRAEQISNRTVRNLDRLGVEAVCVEVEVLIDGQLVLVDPVEVIHW